MNADEKETALSRVSAQEQSLRDFYKKIFDALKRADRLTFTAIQQEHGEMLDFSLDPPDEIHFDKLVAVLKAILSSQNEDKIRLECFYPLPVEQEKTLGATVNEHVRSLGLRTSDLQAVVEETGWTTRRQQTR